MRFRPHYSTAVFLMLLTISLSACKITKWKDMTYMEAGFRAGLSEKELNIFAPKTTIKALPVVIFVHGGSWNSGKKEMYSFFGKRLARKGKIGVIIDYPLSPEYEVNDMTIAVAKAVKWVKDSIGAYGGDPNKLYISGHSAGGHLAALISMKNKYFDKLEITNPIKGVILIDAAGLDMYGFLKKMNYAAGTSYLKTFSNDSEVWKKTSPINYIDESDPPLLIMMGEKTLPSIKLSTEKFLMKYNTIESNPTYYLQEGKKHAPMILQFFNPKSQAYDWIDDFIGEQY